jgi:hypothetical protein
MVGGLDHRHNDASLLSPITHHYKHVINVTLITEKMKEFKEDQHMVRLIAT